MLLLASGGSGLLPPFFEGPHLSISLPIPSPSSDVFGNMNTFSQMLTFLLTNYLLVFPNELHLDTIMDTITKWLLQELLSVKFGPPGTSPAEVQRVDRDISVEVR